MNDQVQVWISPWSLGSFSVSLRVWASTSALWPGKSGPEYPSLAEDPGAGCAQVAKILCSTLSTPYAKATAEFSNLFVWYCEFEWICNMRISVGGSTVDYHGCSWRRLQFSESVGCCSMVPLGQGLASLGQVSNFCTVENDTRPGRSAACTLGKFLEKFVGRCQKDLWGLPFCFFFSKNRNCKNSKHIAILWRDWILSGRASWCYHRRRDTSLGGTWSHFHGLCWNHMKHIDIHRYT